MLENACHKHHLIEVFSVNVHVWFLETKTLLLLDAKFTRKKWLNKAFTTQKPHRNHLEPIEHSTDHPVLKLLHNVAHAGLEIPSTSPNHRKLICGLVLKLKQGETLQF